MNTEPSVTIRDLYPDFTEEQLQEADANLRRYVAVLVRIYERVRREEGPEAARRLAYGTYGELTVPASSLTIRGERSDPRNSNPNNSFQQ
jgi:hypothetical protein